MDIRALGAKKILVVEDDMAQRLLLKRVFEVRSECQIEEVETGDRALEKIAQQAFDLLLLDLSLPGQSGLEVLQDIRRRFNPLELPVIMLTGQGAHQKVVEALQAGANDYVVKPIRVDVFLTRVATHLHLAGLSREMTRMKQMSTLAAMVVTYNHEINNPLSVALLLAEKLEGVSSMQVSATKLKQQLIRIGEIVKQIEWVTQQTVEFDSYAAGVSMVKLKKGGAAE